MVHAGIHVLDFDVVLLKKFYFLWLEVVLLVPMPKCTHLLSVHPVKESSFASITPRVYATIISKSYAVVLTHCYINHSFLSLGEVIHEDWLVELGILLCALTEHTVISRTEQVELPIISEGCTCTQSNEELLHIKSIESGHAVGDSFGDLELLRDLRGSFRRDSG